LGNIVVKGKNEPITAYTADEVRIDITKIMKTPDKDKDFKYKGSENNPILKLKESIFSPEYNIPDKLTSGKEIFNSLKKMFEEITNAVEQIVKDGHEEYIFKKYLQNKWIELLKTWPEYSTNNER
jgi:hypothetical protein